MSAHITVTVEPVSELMRTLPHYARSLQSGGFDAVVTLSSGVPATQCYRTARGRLEYVAGSRSLLDRYNRERNAGRGAP